MAMTKKDFNAIARAFAELWPVANADERCALITAAHSIAGHCGRSNPLFDRDRFIDACKGE